MFFKGEDWPDTSSFIFYLESPHPSKISLFSGISLKVSSSPMSNVFKGILVLIFHVVFAHALCIICVISAQLIKLSDSPKS